LPHAAGVSYPTNSNYSTTWGNSPSRVSNPRPVECLERLGQAGLLGTGYDTLARHDHAEKIAAATSRLADLVAEADEDEVEAAAGRVKAVFEDIEAITVDVEVGEYIAPEEESDVDQMSFQRFNFNEGGVAYPTVTAKAAYYACVVVFSWSATFGTLA